MKKIYILFALFSTLVFGSAKAQNATFNITYAGSTTPDVEAAIDYAARQWGSYLQSNVPIKMLVNWYPLVPGLLGITFPNGELNFSNAPLTDTWYPSCLANALAGVEINTGENDIEIYLNADIAWYTDTTGTVPGGSYDLVTITMHEMGHGLGFLSLAKKTGADGSLGLLTSQDFFPLTTTFPWPDLDSLPSVYDRHVVNGLDEHIDTMPNPSATLGTEFTNNDMWFDGTYTLLNNAGNKAKLYAPGTYALGSSLTHLNEATYPVGTANELMTPSGHPGNANHNPGPISLGIMRDIGWNLSPLGMEEASKVYAAPDVFLYPNPSSDYVNVSLINTKETMESIEITNIFGSTLLTLTPENRNEEIRISQLASGVYFVKVRCGENLYSAKLLKP